MNGSLVDRNIIKPPKAFYVLCLGLLLACFSTAAASALQVTVSILPQVWFVENIGGDLVEVAVLVGPGHSPATYEPTPKQMALLEKADLFLAAGVPFEQGLVPRIKALPKAPLIAGPEAADHDHHHETDPHTWLDPVQAMAMADTISGRLQTQLPSESEAIQSNCRQVKDRLTELDLKVREILAPYEGRVFVVFHPAFGHFAAAYGLVQLAVEAGGHEPGPRHLAEVIEKARACGAKSVVVQPQFSRKSAETVADAIGAEILVLDPLAADYEANLEFLARSLAESFATEDGS